MKDIVEACQISRGGLYLYFESVESVFLEVLRMETEDSDDDFFRDLSEDASVEAVLKVFLEAQKMELLGVQSLNRAIYEYFLSHFDTFQNAYMKKQFEQGTSVLEQLISTGMVSGEFECYDAKMAAETIMYLLEGMKVIALTVGIREKNVDDEMQYIFQNILKVVSK